ncbi:MAG: type II CAAX endopeptidase family protein [Cyclobacteriaceae bacterium]|nr:CPBP family intramembrane metalloprotease [Cyclobacteriaceae bacterium]
MEQKEVVKFSVIVIILSTLICFISYKIGNSNLSILTVLSPSIVALIMTARVRGRSGVKELFIKQTIQKTSLKWFVLSLFGIPVLASLAVLTSLSIDVSVFHLRTTQLLPQMVVIVVIAIGEEYGWRGFMLPRLMKQFSVFSSNLILGLVWGLWHFPAYLIGTGVPLQMNFMVFLLWIVLGALFMGWIYYYTRSVLTSILVHISANAAFNYLLILPEFTGSMNTFWIFIVYLIVILTVVYFLERRQLVARQA